MSAPPDPFNRRPWPMKWIIIAILGCIIPYTWLTLAYRKEGPAHQPYQDNKDRAQVLRLLDSGFNRFELTIETTDAPTLSATELATTERLAGGLPPLLRDVLIDPPVPPISVDGIMAPVAGEVDAPYEFSFAFQTSATVENPTIATLYRRGLELVVLVGLHSDDADTQGQISNQTATVTLPAKTLEAGDYQITLLGSEESRRWRIQME